jgi:HlyD family secretion protein
MNLPIRLTKKRIIWSLIILLVVGPIVYNLVKPEDNSENVLTETVKKQDIKQTVLATGQVVSETDLSLSFKVSGVVAQVNVKEGQKVNRGQVLANLEQKDQIASLTQARGSLAQAQANFQKVLDGASNEDVAVSQVALDNAKTTLEETKRQQEVLVKNAFSALMNIGLAAEANPGNTGGVTATISGTYNSTAQGEYRISIYTSGGLKFSYNGLESGVGDVTTAPQPLGTRGLFIHFSSSQVPVNSAWTVSVPNVKSTSYVTYYNAYQAALETQKTTIAAAENAVTTAQAALDLKKAKARPADLSAAEAQILSAQGQVLAAQAALENTIVRAPANGTITLVDIKPGELAVAQKAVIVLQDVGNLHVEANVSEANIALIKEDQVIDITFDSLGSDRIFKGKVQTVNPASTVVSGVVNYKVVASLDKVEEIKPGMTANLTVLVGEKTGVLAVPQRAVIQDGKKIVRVIVDPKKKTFREVEVETGMEADGGLVQIISGLAEGEEVVTFIKK